MKNDNHLKIYTQFDLKHLNTLGLESKARSYVEISSLQDLSEIIHRSEAKPEKYYILGGGSNLVLPELIEGLVIKVANKGFSLVQEDSDSWFVKAQAGEIWNDFVEWTLKNSFYGLENLSLIPGTVGAAPIQNIGAYGVEIKDSLWQLTAVELSTGALKTFSYKDCHFSYRDSFFKQQGAGKYLIWDVTFRLLKKNKLHLEYGDIAMELQKKHLEPTPLNIAKVVIAIRNSKLPNPNDIGNAGSFFKNPLVTAQEQKDLLKRFPNLVSHPTDDGMFKIAAGWLIEQAGWKGKNLGPVGMYDKQALVLVNHGGACAADVWTLARHVCADVKAKFGLNIEPEPVRW